MEIRTLVIYAFFALVGSSVVVLVVGKFLSLGTLVDEKIADLIARHDPGPLLSPRVSKRGSPLALENGRAVYIGGQELTQKPLIVKSTLTKPARWFVLTKYVEKRGVHPKTGDDIAYLKALVKHDVTDQMRAILKEAKGK